MLLLLNILTDKKQLAIVAIMIYLMIDNSNFFFKDIIDNPLMLLQLDHFKHTLKFLGTNLIYIGFYMVQYKLYFWTKTRKENLKSRFSA